MTPATTDEAAWQTQAGLETLPAWSLGPARKVVLVSPHPDDETLGAGGVLHLLARAGCEVTVIALSDGEAAVPEASAPARARLGRTRCAEQARALAALGLAADSCVRWRLQDGGLSKVLDLVDRLTEAVRGADYCLAPFRQDGHPDHEAAGHAAAAACARSGVVLCEYPIWAWHWREPAAFPALWSRGKRIELDAEAQQHKRSALLHYRTQTCGVAPVLPPAVLAHFQRSFETLLV